MYSKVLDDLRKEIRNCFVDLSHKEVFDLLYKEAWHPEEAAMGNSTLGFIPQEGLPDFVIDVSYHLNVK